MKVIIRRAPSGGAWPCVCEQCGWYAYEVANAGYFERLIDRAEQHGKECAE